MKKTLAFMLIGLISIKASSQNNQNENIVTDTISLDEIVYSANRMELRKNEVASQLEIIDRTKIENLQSQNTSDIILKSGSAFVQKSQMGGGSPVLRGFEASRVLMVMDGVRINNAIFRAGHLQDIITIDQSQLERVEILYGPASTLYGSDALGGVMHFFTVKPKFALEKKEFNTNAYLRYSSASQEKTAHLDFQYASKKLAGLSSITFSKFEDLKAGTNRSKDFENYFERKFYVERIANRDSMIANDNVNLQKFSGYHQYDILQKLVWKSNNRWEHILNVQYSNSSDIPRYDRLTDLNGSNLRFAEWSYGPQQRLLSSLTSSYHSNSRWLSKAKWILAYQNLDQERISRRFRNDNRINQKEQVEVYSFNFDAQAALTKDHHFNYGIELIYNDVESQANTTNIVSGISKKDITRYPDGGSHTSSAALYVAHRWNINDRFEFSDGLRYQVNELRSKIIDTSFFHFPFQKIKQTNDAVTGNLSLLYKIRDRGRIFITGSTGFRTPNVDDLTKIFESAAGTLIIPNDHIRPEYTYNLEIGVDKKLSTFLSAGINVWYTNMTNAMVLKDFQYLGMDSIYYQGVSSKVKAMQNVNKAFLKGTTATLQIKLSDQLVVDNSLSITYGNYSDLENDTIIPLDHIPPIFGRTSVQYCYKKLNLEGYILYNGDKKLQDYSPSGEDNLQYATKEGMPSWLTINLLGNYKINKLFSVQAGVENILDKHYRTFASGISSPGRNFLVTVKLKLNGKD